LATKKRWYPAPCGVHEYRRPTKVCVLCKVALAELKAEAPIKKVPGGRANAPGVEAKRQNSLTHTAFITSAKNRGAS
jgi:hypothetical protein